MCAVILHLDIPENCCSLVCLLVNRIVNIKAKEISSFLCINTAGSIPDGVITIFH
jgi:hypothetical protein